MTAAVTDRFWSKVAVAPGCWEWLAYRNEDGYGRFNHAGQIKSVHRVAYELTSGQPIPHGLEIDHLCRNRGCVNPSHLEAVTHRENILRTPPPELCRNGHDVTNPSAYTRPDHAGGVRKCRTCQAARNRRWRERKRESVD